MDRGPGLGGARRPPRSADRPLPAPVRSGPSTLERRPAIPATPGRNRPPFRSTQGPAPVGPPTPVPIHRLPRCTGQRHGRESGSGRPRAAAAAGRAGTDCGEDDAAARSATVADPPASVAGVPPGDREQRERQAEPGSTPPLRSSSRFEPVDRINRFGAISSAGAASRRPRALDRGSVGVHPRPQGRAVLTVPRDRSPGSAARARRPRAARCAARGPPPESRDRDRRRGSGSAGPACRSPR